jgi:hypothetical protein
VNFFNLPVVRLKPVFLIGKILIRIRKMPFDFFLGHEEIMQLVVENSVNILDGDFVPALRADLFGGAGKDIHSLAATGQDRWLSRTVCAGGIRTQ